MSFHRFAAVIGIVALSASTVVVASRAPHAPAGRGLWPDRPECPHAWEYIDPPRAEVSNADSTGVPPWPTSRMVFTRGLSVPGLKSNVPEFHDCQQIITGSNYGPLMAVFASRGLDTLSVIRDPKTRAELARHDTTVLPAAEVLIYDRIFRHRPIGAGPGFNCLFLYNSSGKLRAKMLPVGGEEKRCGMAANPDTMRVPELTVAARTVPQYKQPADYPPVARWEIATDGTMYIGLKCGAAWCEVGNPEAIANRSAAYTDPASAPAFDAAQRPTDRSYLPRSVKGWHDVQFLAMPSGTATAPPTPSGVRGWVFPHPDLALQHFEERRDIGRWHTVSYVALEPTKGAADAPVVTHYKTKFNFAVVAPNSSFSAMTRIAICFGTRKQCGVTEATVIRESCTSGVSFDASGVKPRYWAAMIHPAGSTIHRCVTRRDHGANGAQLNMPATARWRWILNDETVWQECRLGCCEVESGS